jgi:hypothetical protein
VADDIGAGLIDDEFQLVGQLIFTALKTGMAGENSLAEVSDGRQVQEISLDLHNDVSFTQVWWHDRIQGQCC